jgi:1,4-dihydroxy-2-naphthoyl-CoA hydrolase
MENIWKKNSSLENLNKFNRNTLVAHLGIILTEVGNDFLIGTMPVNSTTHQPFGLLHGGASCVLAESLGSIAANMCVDGEDFAAVGQHIEATHLRSVQSGIVKGIARPIFLGRSSQTWKIEIYNEENKLICDSKIIMAVIKKR